MSLADLPAVNATLNGFSAILLIVGWFFIRSKNVTAHRNCMLAALATSALFLACYLVYHFGHQVTTKFPIGGFWKYVYLSVLIPHIILAVVMLPMIFTVLVRAFRGDFERHRRLARITLPIWIYVSITGVVVYVMLYRVPWTEITS